MVEGLLIRSTTRVDDAFLKHYPNLKVVVTSTSGTDHLDTKALKARNIIAMHTPEANATSAAELTWSLILACHRPLLEAQARMTKERGWRTPDLVGREVHGKTLGIVGLGRVGQRVARIGAAFGCNLMAYDPYKSQDTFDVVGARRVGLDELLRCCDIITLHVPLTKETRRMLHRVYLENLTEGTILINTSRGEVIPEDEILYALSKGWLGRVGLDVFEKEPLSPSSPLRSDPRVLLTPHLGASTHEALERSCFEAAQKIVDYFNNGTVSDVVIEL